MPKNNTIVLVRHERDMAIFFRSLGKQGGISEAILAGIPYKIPERIFEGISAIIPEVMPTRTFVSSRFSKAIPGELRKGILGVILGRILRGISA